MSASHSGEFRRLSPLTLVQQSFVGILVLGSTMLQGGDAPRLMIVFLVLYGVLLIPFYVAQYLRFSYWITERELFIHSGVFRRVRRSIAIERIQNVAIERGVVARLLGIASVKIETAGSAKAEGVLSFVQLSEARRLRTLLRTEVAPGVVTSQTPPVPSYAMPFRHVVLSGVFQFSLVYFAAALSLWSYAEQLGFTDVSTQLEQQILETVDVIDTENASSLWVTGMAFGILSLLLGWVTGIVVNIVRFYRFRIELRESKVFRAYGLLTLREGSTPYERIQSLLIRCNPLMRRWNWFRLDIQTLGFESGERGFQVAVPFAQRDVITDLAPKLRPFVFASRYSGVSPFTVIRRGMRLTILIAVVTGIPALWWPNALWGLCLIGPAWTLAVLQFRCHRWALHEDNLFIRTGAVRQRFWIVPVERMQALITNATVFQRLRGLCSLTVDTAGAGWLRRPCIVDLDQTTASELRRTLNAAFRDHFTPT